MLSDNIQSVFFTFVSWPVLSTSVNACEMSSFTTTFNCFSDWTVPDGKTAGKKPFAYSSANSILVEIVSNGSIRLILPITGIIPQSHALYFVDINVG